MKSSFPKIIYKSKENSGKDSLETIINKLFLKLKYFYELYKKLDWLDISKIKNIQLIFFYDNVQLNNIKQNLIREFIEKNSANYSSVQHIPIHLYIVYTLPAITNISIFELKKDFDLLKEKAEKAENEINILREKDKQRENEIKNLGLEIQRLMLYQKGEAEKKSNKKEEEKNSFEKEIKFNDANDIFNLFSCGSTKMKKSDNSFEDNIIKNKNYDSLIYNNNDNINNYSINFFDFTRNTNDKSNNNINNYNYENYVKNDISNNNFLNFFDNNSTNNSTNNNIINNENDFEFLSKFDK